MSRFILLRYITSSTRLVFMGRREYELEAKKGILSAAVIFTHFTKNPQLNFNEYKRNVLTTSTAHCMGLWGYGYMGRRCADRRSASGIEPEARSCYRYIKSTKSIPHGLRLGLRLTPRRLLLGKADSRAHSSPP
jgi:hypothetical protein